MTPTPKIAKKSGCIPWMKLILGVVPSFVFGLFTVVFTIQQNAFSKATHESEQQQQLQQRKQAIFDNCIDVISDLLVSPYFNRSDVRHLRPVREKVLTALRQIDATQKRDIIFFLYTNELIHTDIPSEYRLDLHGADLTNVQFIKSTTVRCDLPNLSLRGVLASNIIFSGCYLQKVDFGESVMDGSLFYDCFMGFAAFENANLTRAKFHSNALYTVNLAGTLLVQSSFLNNTGFVNTNWTNTNLLGSKITNQDLLGTTPSGFIDTSIILNTRFPNGSFLIEASQLIINGGAEEECNATSNMAMLWSASLDIAQMQTYKQMNNLSIYPAPIEGNCYFIAEQFGLISQNVDVKRFSTFIDSGQASATISARFGCSGTHPSDEAVLYAGYLDVADLPIVGGPIIRTGNKPFEFQSQNGSIPAGTRTIIVSMAGYIITLMNTTIPRYCVFDDVKLFIF